MLHIDYYYLNSEELIIFTGLLTNLYIIFYFNNLNDR
jgi:hypothetical protein